MSMLISRQERRTVCDPPEQESRLSRRETCHSQRSDVQDDNCEEEKDRFFPNIMRENQWKIKKTL